MKPLKSSESSVEAALKFARETSEAEIASIERLHRRTLLALGLVIGLLTLAGTLLGWVGFNNLRQSVIATTTTVTQQQVKDVLSQDLTTKQINAGVQEAMTGEVKKGLQTAIQAEVASQVTGEFERQKPQIEKLVGEHTSAVVANIAPRLADEAISKRLAAPSLTANQESALQRLIVHRYYPRSEDQKQIEIHSGGSHQEQNYAAQFERIFKDAGWKTSLTVLKPYSTHAPGLSLGVMAGHIDDGTRSVQAAFSDIGLAVPIVAVENYEYINDNFNSYAFLIVLSPIH